MPQTDSSATGDVMSKTPLNKGQSQVDIVPNPWRFRTIRDPFQENRSQRLEVIKGQKITPLREGICPLERQGRWLSSFVVVMDGTVTPTILHRLPHRSFKRGQLWRWVMYCCFGTVLSRNNESFGFVLTFEFHDDMKEFARKIETQNRLATNFSEPSQGGFFSVLSVRNFQEKKS